MKAEKAGIVERFVQGLGRTRVGRDALAAAKIEEERLAERSTARANLTRAEADRASLPELAQGVEQAKANYDAEMERLAMELHRARIAHDRVAGASDRLYASAESRLRNTAPAIVAEHGPVVQAVLAAREHLRAKHCLGVEDELVRRFAALKPLTSAPEDLVPIERARDRVKDADAALELIDALEFTLAEFRDLQLEVEPSLEAVREVVANCPAACGCGYAFAIEAALEEAISSEGVPTP